MREKYDPYKVNLLLRYLQQQAEKNAARFYEIYVDNLKVVGKTNDVTEFEGYNDFITPDTKQLRVLIYSTALASPRNEPHYFYFEDEKPPAQPQPLSGMPDMEKRLSDKIAQEWQRWNAEQSAKEHEETKRKLRDAEEYIETLEGQITDYKGQITEFKSKKLHLGEINLGELASVVLEGFVRRNPQMLAKLPGGEALAGIIVQDNAERQQQVNAPASEVTFSKATTEKQDPAQQVYIQLLQQLEAAFVQRDLDTVMKILGVLIQHPEHLPTIAELLGITTTP